MLDKDGDGFINLREAVSLSDPDNSSDIPDAIVIYVDAASSPGSRMGTVADPFNRITKGIRFAGPGDTVSVATGTYLENIVVDKNLFLEGEDPENTVIDGFLAELPTVRCFK